MIGFCISHEPKIIIFLTFCSLCSVPSRHGHHISSRRCPPLVAVFRSSRVLYAAVIALSRPLHTVHRDRRALRSPVGAPCVCASPSARFVTASHHPDLPYPQSAMAPLSSAFTPSLPIPTQRLAVAHRRRLAVTPARRPFLPPLPALSRIRRIITVANDSSVTADLPHAAIPASPATTAATETQPPHVAPAIDANSSPDTDIVGALSAEGDELDESQVSIFTSLDDISEIIQTVEESDLADFRIEHNGITLEISREGGRGFDPEGNLNPLRQPVFADAAVQPPQVMDPDLPFEYADDPADGANVAVATETNEMDVAVDVVPDQPAPENMDPDTVYDSDFVVTSNRVGFFFCGAKNKPPLVNVGDTVSFNQPVCIIEQLGQQYVYLSEAAGKVVKVFVEDGDPVMFSTQIMIIRPD